IAVGRQGWTRLGQSVPLENKYTGGVEELGDVLGQRGAAGDEIPQVSTDALVQFFEYQLVRQALSQTQPGGVRLRALFQQAHLPSDAQTPLKESPFQV